jgi:hypothetical protein
MLPFGELWRLMIVARYIAGMLTGFCTASIDNQLIGWRIAVESPVKTAAGAAPDL